MYECLLSAFKTNWHCDGAAVDDLEKKFWQVDSGKIGKTPGSLRGRDLLHIIKYGIRVLGIEF